MDNWDGVNHQLLEFNMNSYKNNSVTSPSDITYTIKKKCVTTANITCTLSKASGTIIGSANHGVNEDYFTVSINPAGNNALSEGETAWVDITATSTAPYSETLSGKLILEVGSSEISYEIIDSANQPYLTVNITNSQSVGSNITLSYSPQVVLLDMNDRFYLNSSTSTDVQQNNYTYLNSITSFVNPLSTTTVKFYKINSAQNYSYNSMSNTTPIITLTH